MANEFITPVEILQESMMRLENSLVLLKHVNREFDGHFAVENEKAGYQVFARVPVRFRGRVGDAIQTEDIRETMVPVAINRLWGVDMDISDQDLTLVIDRFGERYIDGAASTVANRLEGEGYDLYPDFFNATGTPGTVPTSLATYTDAGVILHDHSCPPEGRAVIVNPRMQANVLGFGANLFNPVKEISRQYLEGTMGQAVGFKWSMGQNVARHTTGTISAASAPTVTTAPVKGDTSIVTGNWSNSSAILKKGDIVAFAGSNGVNPVSYRDSGSLRTFTATADVTSDGSGNATIPVSPAFDADAGDANTPGSPFQTVTAYPAAGALVSVHGLAYANFANIASKSSPQGLAFHKDAITFACVKQALPGGLDWSEQITHPKLGVAMRLTRGFDIRSNRRYTRLEVLGGWKTLRPELGCRVQG